MDCGPTENIAGNSHSKQIIEYTENTKELQWFDEQIRRVLWQYLLDTFLALYLFRSVVLELPYQFNLIGLQAQLSCHRYSREWWD